MVVVGEDLVVGETGEAHGGGTDLAKAYAVAPTVAAKNYPLRLPRGGSVLGSYCCLRVGGESDIKPTALEVARGEDLADKEFFADDD